MDGDAFVNRFELGGDGPRVGIKDSIDVAGYPTQAGSRAFANVAPPAQHADVVQALLEAGWRLVGKTQMHELAYGVTGINAWAGTPRNPHWPDRVPGGSSSGSAVAVAANLCDAAIGTDTGGSIRVPATCCGVIGLKTTFGRISRGGVHPHMSSLDCVGPFARDLATIEQAMHALDATYRSQPTPGSVRVGYVGTQAAAVVDATVRAHVGAAGQTVEAIGLDSFGAAFDAALSIIAAENWAAYGHLADSGRLGTDVRVRLVAARAITPEAVAAGEAVRRRFIAEVDTALERVDVLALPTLADVPLTLAQATDASRSLSLTALLRQFNLSGHPAISLPLTTPDGLPVGLQLVGRRGADAALCAAARLFVK